MACSSRGQTGKKLVFQFIFQNLETWNLTALHLHLDDRVVSKILRRKFAKFCENIDLFLAGKIPKIPADEIVKNGDFLLKMADRQLNIGHFNEVDENWRVLYALVSFVQSFALFRVEKYQEAITIADKGLCMGRLDEQKVAIRKLAWLIHEHLPSTSKECIHSSFLEHLEHSEQPHLKPLPNSAPIEECDEDDFEKLCVAVGSDAPKPLLVKGLARNMPAFKKWTFEYLQEKLHSRTFPVEIGTKYSDEDWSQRMMTFKEFLQNEEHQKLYLAQHRLFDQVPHLKNDVIIPDVCFLNSTDSTSVDLNMWIGPAGTISPLHTDPRNNMFVQVHGSKLFRLVAPEESEGVYPFDGMLSNTSQVDAENPDLMEHPKFSKIRVFDAVVHAGDALFIPEKWWHYVRSTTPSISVSFWFD